MRHQTALSLLAIVLSASVTDAFAPNTKNIIVGGPASTSTSQKFNTAQLPSTSTSLAALPTPSVSLSVDTPALTQFFLETLISYGVPAFFWIVIIAFAAKSFKGAQKSGNDGMPNGGLFGKNVVGDLYDDLYGSTNEQNKSPFAMLSPNSGRKSNPKNLGIPAKQFLSITKLNDVYQSYDYSLTAATQSKAKAAAQYRSSAFDSALQKAFDSSLNDITSAQKLDLLIEEKAFLNRGAEILSGVTELQRQLTDLVIKDEMNQMEVDIGEVDAHTKVIDATIVDDDAATADTEATNTTAAAVEKTSSKKKSKKSNVKKDVNKLVKEIEKQNTELLRLEMEFIRAVVEIMGPDRANGIRAALLGNIASGGAGVAGGLLTSLQNRPLASVLNTIGYGNEENGNNLFVTDFPGDVSASQVETLREEVTAIIRAAKPGDEALLVLQSGGGTVTGYGLAAAQLQRFKKHGMKLTICVEQVAASGGYMMTCVADRVVATPFAVLGSIGVISDLPNVYERLKKEGVEFQTVTAGKYKRTLTPTKKVTPEDIEKTKGDLEGILTLFKGFVAQNRPSLDIDDVATGETWFGEDALAKGLCDELSTVDDVLCDYVDAGSNVYQVRYAPEMPPGDALSNLLPIGQASAEQNGGIVRGIAKWVANNIIPVVAEELKNELKLDTTGSNSVKDRYMFRDSSDSSKNIRMEG